MIVLFIVAFVPLLPKSLEHYFGGVLFDVLGVFLLEIIFHR